MLSILGKNSGRQHFEIFFFFSGEKKDKLYEMFSLIFIGKITKSINFVIS